MAEEIRVTGAQVAALAEKLESMTGSFSDEELAALRAVFALAGDGLAAGSAEVDGFGISPTDSLSLNFTMPTDQRGTQGILIGLLKNGSAHGTGGGGGAGKVSMQDFH